MKFSKHILHVILCTAAVLFVFLGSTASAAFILKDTNTELGGYVRVGATYNITESKDANAYFTSSDSSIISITKSGKMTPLKAGQVSIASYTITGTKIASKTVIARVGATSIDLNYSKLYLPTGYDYALRPQLLVSLTPADSTDRLSYASSSSDIASVEIGSGKITAKANGAATITVYSKLTAATKNDDPSNVTASAKVYVHNHDGNGSYTAIDSFHHYRACTGTNCHFTSDTSQRKYYGEHFFNSDNVCSYCGYEAKKLDGHTHTWKLTSSSELHWYVCENSDCGATKDPEIHNFGSDNKCKVCGLTHHHNSWETRISLDFTSHWYACSRCDARKENTLHYSSTPSKCGAPTACQGCGLNYELGAHSTEFTWYISDSTHYKMCADCGARTSAYGVHLYEYDTDDTMKCSECGYIHTHDWGEWQADGSVHKRACASQIMSPRGYVFKPENQTGEHTFGSDGLCTACAAEDIPELNDDVYEIASPSQLLWFSKQVNGGDDKLNARLVSDIDLSNTDPFVIGSSDSGFRGVFDGNGKRIDGLHLAVTSDNTGLFGSVIGGKVKNMSVSGEITLHPSVTYARIGGVVGRAKGGAVISDIMSDVNISGDYTSKHIGGIVGSSEGLSNTLTIEKCIYSGTVSVPGSNECIGGILGYANADVMISCCGFTGSVTGAAGKHVGGILGYINNADFGGLYSCFAAGKSSGSGIIGTVKECGKNVWGNAVTRGTSAFGGSNGNMFSAYEISDWSSGEAAFKLNDGKVSGGQIWYQTIGSDKYPVFSGKTVYKPNRTTYTNEFTDVQLYFGQYNTISLHITRPGTLVVAAYKDGRLLDVAAKNMYLISNPSVTLDSLGLNTDGADKVKAMFLNNLTDMTPLCENEINEIK